MIQIIFSIILSTRAFAIVHDSQFLGVAEALEKQIQLPQNFAQLTKATIHIVGARTDDCTGTVVSEKGHVLTPMHCILGCAFDQRALVTITDSVDQVDFTFVSPRTPTPQYSCPGMKVIGTTLRAPDVVYVGSGYNRFDSSKIGKLSADKARQLVHREGDFAILKFNTRAQTPCMPVSEAVVNEGMPLWSLGFPEPTERPEGTNSDGKAQYLSRGTKAKNFLQNANISTWKFDTEALSNFQLWMNEFLLSNLDGVGGSSGSPVVNDQGQMVAMTDRIIGTEGESFLRYVEYSHMSVPIAKIKGAIERDMGAAQAAEIFSCK